MGKQQGSQKKRKRSTAPAEEVDDDEVQVVSSSKEQARNKSASNSSKPSSKVSSKQASPAPSSTQKKGSKETDSVHGEDTPKKKRRKRKAERAPEPEQDGSDEVHIVEAEQPSTSKAAVQHEEPIVEAVEAAQDENQAEDVEEDEEADPEGDESLEGANADTDDEYSYDSAVDVELQTNVTGAMSLAASSARQTKLKGVKFVEDEELHTEARTNMNRLLRAPRYYDDDISEPMAKKHKAGPRCFKCGIPGHVAAKCPAPPDVPCFLCAGFGHDQYRCPKALCYNCHGFGHSLKDCYQDTARTDQRTCVRCGEEDCKASGHGDWWRSMRGCSKKQYSKSVLQRVRCFVCGEKGHFCCKSTPKELFQKTCCLCGMPGHTGQMDDCPQSLPKVLQGEIYAESKRQGRMRQEEREREGRHRAAEMLGSERGGSSRMHYQSRAGDRGGARQAPESARGYGGDRWGSGYNRGGVRDQGRGYAVPGQGFGPNNRFGYRQEGGAASAPRTAPGGRRGQGSNREPGGSAQHTAGMYGCAQTLRAVQPGAAPPVHAAMHPPPDQLGMQAPQGNAVYHTQPAAQHPAHLMMQSQPGRPMSQRVTYQQPQQNVVIIQAPANAGPQYQVQHQVHQPRGVDHARPQHRYFDDDISGHAGVRSSSAREHEPDRSRYHDGRSRQYGQKAGDYDRQAHMPYDRQWERNGRAFSRSGRR